MAESAPKPPSRLPKLAAAAGVLFVLLLSLWLLSNRKPRPDSNTRGDSDAATMFAEAKTLIRQGKWAAAKEKLEAVREEDDDYETRQLDNYLKVVAEELPNEARFATAADAIAKGELGRASAALAQVKTQDARPRAHRREAGARAAHRGPPHRGAHAPRRREVGGAALAQRRPAGRAAR